MGKGNSVGMVEIPYIEVRKENGIQIEALSQEWKKAENGEESVFNKIAFTHDDAKYLKDSGSCCLRIINQNMKAKIQAAKYVITFCRIANSYPVFQKELGFIHSRQKKLGQFSVLEKQPDEHIVKNVKSRIEPNQVRTKVKLNGTLFSASTIISVKR
jgi:hypothetical protein